MITRIYIDNFRSLTNFELALDRTNLFLGPNGSGKSAVLEVLRKLQYLIVCGDKVAEVFSSQDLSNMQKSNAQKFEVSLATDEGTFDYALTIQHQLERGRMRILEERLHHEGKPLFDFQEGNAQLYRDNYSEGPKYPFDWTQSGLGVLQKHKDNKKLTRFKEQVERWVIVRPCPPLFHPETRTEDEMLDLMMENFVGWYRHASQENMGKVVGLFKELEEVIPGFDSLSLSESGENARALKVLYQTAEWRKQIKPLRFCTAL